MDPNADKDDNATNLPSKKKRKLQKAKNKNDSHLFTDDNPTTTVHGTGFNSKVRLQNIFNTWLIYVFRLRKKQSKPF